VLSRTSPGRQGGSDGVAGGGRQRALPRPARRQIVPCGHLQLGGVPIIPPVHPTMTHFPPRKTLPAGHLQPPPALATMPGLHTGSGPHAPLANRVPCGHLQLGAVPIIPPVQPTMTHFPPRKTPPAGHSQPPPALATMPGLHT